MTSNTYLRARKTFDDELAGQRGEFWQKEAQRRIEKIRSDYMCGQLIIESDGAGIWRSSGNYIPDECAYQAFVAGIPIDLDATEKKRTIQTEKFLSDYRRNYKGPTEEQIAEMRAVFGKGETVVNVITGTVTRL